MNRHYVSSGVPFSLGRTGEHLARAIVFDLRQWKNLYGEGEAELMARRSGETIMYPVPLDIVGDAAIWVVTERDVAIPGADGECELRYRKVDGTLAKSEIWSTSVRPSMEYEESEPPAETKPWIETLEQYIAQVMDWRESIEQTAKRAEEIAERTEDVADDVHKAEEARDSAGEYAEQARLAVNRVENMEIEVVTLSPGSNATAENRSDENSVKLLLGLPEGRAGYTPVKGVDYFDGADGYTPVKGVDYFDGKQGDPGYTPQKGVDYFDGKDGYTPQKGIDYFDGKDGADGYTPVKGVDYTDGKDGYTPIKGVDYFDGEKGESGVYVGSDTPPDGATVWIDPSGNPSSTEPWKFTLDNGTTVTKLVVVVG